MWIGLLDAKRDPFHPLDLTRADCDVVRWRLDYLRHGWLRLTNHTPLQFHAHHTILRPTYYAFFREVDDVKDFFAVVKFLEDTIPDLVEAGNTLELGRGQLSMSMPVNEEVKRDATARPDDRRRGTR